MEETKSFGFDVSKKMVLAEEEYLEYVGKNFW